VYGRLIDAIQDLRVLASRRFHQARDSPQRMTLAAAYALAHPGRSGAPRILPASATPC
jgi:hypothetical protein